MELILLEKVTNLGDLGDKVNVKSGFGRNYLLPQGKAVVATADKIAEFEKRRAELERKAAEELQKSQQRADAIGLLKVVIEQKAGEGGKLFGSVGTQDIADAVNAAGAEVLKSEVRLPEGALRHLGEFAIDIQLHSDVTASLTLTIAAEE